MAQHPGQSIRRPWAKPGRPALLQVTDNSDTDACRACELLLGESGSDSIRADPVPGGVIVIAASATARTWHCRGHPAPNHERLPGGL